MKIDKKIVCGLFLIAVIGLAVGVNQINNPTVIDSEAEDLEVTIYNTDLGVVKEYRVKYIPAGINNVLYEGVASRIDPTSVRLKAVDSAINVLEQNFQYDLVSRGKILRKYIDKDIVAYLIYGDKKEMIEGTLLSYRGDQLILKDKEGRIQILDSNNLVLPELPEGLMTKPTLVWILEVEESRNHTLELSYTTSGMTWKADYVVVTNKDDTKLDLNGWVTVTNNAGTTFKDTALKLVAGDVHRVREEVRREKATGYAPVPTPAPPRVKQFEEEALFEYHMYDLQRRTTLKNNEQKQISLLEAAGIDVEKEYLYDDIRNWWWYGRGWSDTGEKKVNVMLNFDNSEENNLGIPLPKGTVRVFKEDREGKLQFIGEDSIDHTPKNETISLFIGQAFDIVGERKQMDFNKLADWYEYEWEVNLRNHKDEGIVVTVLERTGGDWEIIEENYEHTKVSNNRIEWRVPVKANGESTLSYAIRYKR
ncbi:MAG: DUF4139 domain-containing protein [Euryarchaeota archaeon]|nr:DUF4139 domain-containing protein [Euryarchaeota archaeon]